MAGIDTSSFGNPYVNSTAALFGNNSNSGVAFDYDAVVRSAQDQYNSMKAKLDGASSTASSSSVATMKKDAAAYLDSYTSAMGDVLKAAGKLANGGLQKMLTNSDGEMTEDTLKNVTDAVQNMVDAYNRAINLLGDNSARGRGNSAQFDRMAGQPPLAEFGLETLGITVGKSGALTLDAEALKAAFTDADARDDKGAQMSFIKGLVGELASNISSDASAGMNVSAQSLIGNSLTEIKSGEVAANPYADMYTYIRGNPMLMSNQAALSMMNFTV